MFPPDPEIIDTGIPLTGKSSYWRAPVASDLSARSVFFVFLAWSQNLVFMIDMRNAIPVLLSTAPAREDGVRRYTHRWSE